VSLAGLDVIIKLAIFRIILWGKVMRRISLIALLGIFALLGAGCGGGEDTAEEVQPTDTVPVAPAETGETPPTDAEADPEAVVQANEGDLVPPPPPPGNLPPELIASTDPNQRVQQIAASRNDPFSGVSVGTTDVTRVPVEEETTPQARTTPFGPNGIPQPGGNRDTGGRAQLDPNRLADIPDLVGGGRNGQQQVPPPPPPPPQPTLARAVQVMGIVQIGNTPYAIVQAPNEPTSRYVRPGQRLSNGEVLVRRIEMGGSEPVVVLEQVGVEVRLAAGSGAPPSDGATTASLPLPPVPVN